MGRRREVRRRFGGEWATPAVLAFLRSMRAGRIISPAPPKREGGGGLEEIKLFPSREGGATEEGEGAGPGPP